jgi:hypothetical protein
MRFSSGIQQSFITRWREQGARVAEELGKKLRALRLGGHLRQPGRELPGLIEDDGETEVAGAELLADDGEAEAAERCRNARWATSPSPCAKPLRPNPTSRTL